MNVRSEFGPPSGRLVSAGEKKSDPVRISLIRYNENDLEEKEVKTIEECFLPADPRLVTWINIDGVEDPAVIEKIAIHFDIHRLVLEDMLNTDQRPKTDDYADYLFIVLKSLRYDEKEGKVNGEQVSLVFGPNYVLSLRERESDSFNPVKDRLKNPKSLMRQSGSDYLAYALMDAIVDNYFVMFEKIGEEIEDLEEELIAEPTVKILENIHDLKRTLIFLRKSVWPVREVIANLEKLDPPRITRSTQIYLRDVYDHTVRVLETIEGYHDLISGMLDIYLSSVSNRLNEVMKVLTIIATIFIPITFLTGVFGMNFRNMGVLDLPFAFPGSLILMACVAGFLLIYFRKKRCI
ncbi:MAG: magnesium/cobalt transporter CorA [Deltaproteobacteria bacterium]